MANMSAYAWFRWSFGLLLLLLIIMGLEEVLRWRLDDSWLFGLALYLVVGGIAITMIAKKFQSLN